MIGDDPIGATAKKDNIPEIVDRILELLGEAHAAASRVKPEPGVEGKEPEQVGLEAAVVKARDRAQHLCKRLNEIADAVGPL